MNAPALIASRTFNLPQENIDTDQIIPAQFLTTTSRKGLGQYCFHQWRFDASGAPLADSPLKGFDPARHGILVAGTNFGCGSSREHAPWALLDMGVRAVVSSRFADIFRANALKNGLLPVTVSTDVAEFLLDHPDCEVRVDIRAARLEIPGLGTFDFPLDRFAAHCLLSGIDPLDYLLQHEQDIAAYEQRHAG